MRKKLDSWAVAAAILLGEYEELHYTIIASDIQESGLTTLGEKGSTPGDTVRSQMTTRKVDGQPVFESPGEGDFHLTDPEWARRLPKVRRALKAYREYESRGRPDSEDKTRLNAFNARVRELEEQNETLRNKLKQISEICADTNG